jgi:formylglycine-generating enzyme required for sulfatase activity
MQIKIINKMIKTNQYQEFTLLFIWQMKKIIAVLFLFLLISTCALAQKQEQRVALVIGNGSYKESPLKNPANDANDIAQTLRGLGFKVILRTNATRREMVESVRELGRALKLGGVGFFYYAGHGVQSKGKNYLIPVGGEIKTESDLEFEALDVNMIMAQMDEAANRVNILVLDACRNNPFARSFRSSARGLAQMDGAKGSFVAYATSPGSVADDGEGRNGIYTKHLLASLSRPDSKLEDVFKRVRIDVAKETLNRQIPWDSSSVLGEFYFQIPAQVISGDTQNQSSVSSAQATSSTIIEKAYWDSVKDSKNPDEFRNYLEQFPNGLFASLAVTRIRALEQSNTKLLATATTLSANTNTLASPVKPGSTYKDCSECPEMVVVPSGSFIMGSPNSEIGRDPQEGPQRRVTIKKTFSVGKYEITYAQWISCIQERGCSNPSGNIDRDSRDMPATAISWEDAKQYVNWLSNKTKKSYRLLTEAEWEYAARSGTSTIFSFGNKISKELANFNSKESYAGSVTSTPVGKVVPVGSYQPNAFGLYDMHGNVWEWTEDCRNDNYIGAPIDGSAWTVGDCTRRTLRGGSYDYPAHALRSADRQGGYSYIRSVNGGFRVARDN